MLTTQDRDRAQQFQKEYKELQALISAMKTVGDYHDPAKLGDVRGRLSRLESDISAMSDPKADLVAQMRKIHDTLKTAFETNLSKAKAQQAAAKPAAPVAPAAAGPSASPDSMEFEDKYNFGFYQKEYDRQAEKFDSIDPIAVQDPQSEAGYRQIIEKLRGMLSKVKDRAHPAVKDGESRVAALQSKLEAVLGKAKALAGAAGNVDEQLSLIQKQFPMGAFSPWLAEPYDEGRISAWGKDLRNWRDAVPAALEFFAKAKQLSVKARTKEFEAYAHWFESQVIKCIDAAIAQMRKRWEDGKYPAVHGGRKMDEHNLRDEGFVAAVFEEVEWAEKALSQQSAFERGHFGKEQAKTSQEKAQVAGLAAKVSAGRAAAVKNVRMPEPASTDPALLAAAREAIAKSDFELKVARMVVNYDKHSFEKILFYDKAFWRVRWDEFQVTVAEGEGEEYWLRPVLLQYYHSAAPGTPTGRWFIHETWRSCRILKENIGS